MPKKTGLVCLVVLMALGTVPAPGLEVGLHVSPLFVLPLAAGGSGGEPDPLFASSVGGELSLGFAFGDNWEVRAGFGLVPLVLNVDDRDSQGLLSSATAGLGLLIPFVGQSTLGISGDIGLYTVRYKDTRYDPAFCFDLEGRIQKDVASWLTLFGGVGYSSYLVDFTSEALLDAVHLKAGLSIFLCQP